jgi:hypothetical protein
VAPTKTSKTASPGSAAARTSLDDAAAFIGTSLGELMNRKDALAKQMAAVEQQIAAARDRLKAGVSSTVAAARKAVPSGAKKTKTAASAGRTGNRKKKRPLPPDDPMVQATTRNATAQVKARTAQAMRTTRRSGNR